MRRVLLWLVLAPLAFGQSAELDNHTLTITASRTFNLVPDQAVIFVAVDTSGPDASLEAALAAVQGTGITAADLSSASGVLGGVDWYFNLTVPFAKLKDTIAALTAAQKQAISTTRVSFTGLEAQVSPALQAAQGCIYPALLSDARAQAEKVAAAVGVTVREIVSLSDGYGQATSTVRYADFSWVSAYSISSSAAFIPSTLIELVGLLNPFVPAPPSACTLVVQFRISQ